VGIRSSPLIVGRDGELRRIEHALEAAADGRPTLVIVRGEAGIGKSRLVREAIERARAAGSAILHGACLALGGDGLPYLPLIEAIRGLGRELAPERLNGLLGPARADLAALLPDLAPTGPRADRPEAEAEPRSESAVDRARLFERFLGVLRRLGEPAPALVVVEDVQWIDPATRDMITFLARNVTSERIVWILTCRTDDLAPGHPILAWLAEIGRSPQSVRIDLGRLDRGDVLRQLESIENGPVPDALVETVWRRSEGHPLFAEELIASAGAGGDDQLPSLVEVLLARVAGLDPETTAIVRALAVVGRPVDDRLLGPLLDRSAGEIGAALRQAAARGVLVAVDDGRHAFRHELLREVVEHEASAAERRELHERLARQLEAHPELGDDSPASAAGELARHWAAAGMPVEAHRAAIAAASAADAVHAFADVQRLLERAISLEPLLPPEAVPSRTERVDVRRRAADAADLAGRLDRAAELLQAALDLIDPESDPALAGSIHSRMGYVAWARGDSEASLAHHRAAIGLVPEVPPTRERALVLGAYGGALMGLGRWAESRPICEAAIACAVEVGSTRDESRARSMLGSDLVSLGEVDAGLEELRAAHRLAGTEPTELFIVTAYNLGLNLLVADRAVEALGPATAAREAAVAGGVERRFGGDLAALVADLLLRLGRWDEADRAIAAGLALDQRGRGTPYLAAVRARLLARRGQLDEARSGLDAIDRGTLDPDTAVFVAAVTAETALIATRPEVAADAVREGLGHLEWIDDAFWGLPLVTFGLRAAAELAEAARASRDEARLAAMEDGVSDLRDRLDVFRARPTTPTGRAMLASADAEVSRIGGLTDPEPWARAIAAWEPLSDPAEAAYARYRYAEASLRRTGVRADVAAELAAAWRSAIDLGAEPLRAELETLARRARINLGAAPGPTAAEGDGPVAEPSEPPAGRSPGGVPHGLSAREIEVLRLVAAGRSNGEIAERLFITRKTAGVHVTHILDKMGVSNRVEAAMAGVRLGLVSGDDEERSTD
jgi:ATP/maltotriose-dependent transcriptional regulator MalT